MVTLVFDAVQVDPDFAAANYQPFIRLAGTDEYGESYAGLCALPANSLQVSAIRLVSIAGLSEQSWLSPCSSRRCTAAP